MTCRPSTCASCKVNASVMPSAKYSWLGSAEKLSSGKDGYCAFVCGAVAVDARRRCRGRGRCGLLPTLKQEQPETTLAAAPTTCARTRATNVYHCRRAFSFFLSSFSVARSTPLGPGETAGSTDSGMEIS